MQCVWQASLMPFCRSVCRARNVWKLLSSHINPPHVSQLPLLAPLKPRYLHHCNSNCVLQPSVEQIIVSPRRLFTRGPVSAGMELQDVVSVLKAFAPTHLAAEWDNVGLLVKPSGEHFVQTMLLTIDLTETVLEEALRVQAQMVLAYHPPIFHPLKTLSGHTWKERLIVRSLENRLAIYSPHTSYDALAGGLTDWLAQAFGESTVSVLHQSSPSALTSCGHYHLSTTLHGKDAMNASVDLQSITGDTPKVIQMRRDDADNTTDVILSMNVTEQVLLQVLQCLSKYGSHARTEINTTTMVSLPNTGMGRLCQFKEPMSIKDAVQRVKEHLGLPLVRLALGTQHVEESTIQSVALCAGSGGSVLKGVKADMYLTGEMSHHEVLDATAVGTSVVLCDHSNTERGFLPHLRNILVERLQQKVKIVVSVEDKDPLKIL
uniref:NIF3-like protein 1 n=2 Tax=Eptatretus burgeri TaxID=7764 RepID=A0A8C4NEJ2_EPTBU